MYKKISCLIAAVALSQAAIAEDCGQLKVSLSNHSGESCTLTRQEIRTGAILPGDSIPSIMDNSQSYHFTLEQVRFSGGPDVYLTYHCGENKIIGFRVRQNYCMFEAGDISSEMVDRLNLNVRFKASRGDYSHAKAGSIETVIEKG